MTITTKEIQVVIDFINELCDTKDNAILKKAPLSGLNPERLKYVLDNLEKADDIIGKLSEGLVAAIDDFTRMEQRNKELKEGIKQIKECGHNDECLMCAVKDTLANKLLDK